MVPFDKHCTLCSSGVVVELAICIRPLEQSRRVDYWRVIKEGRHVVRDGGGTFQRRP